MNFNKLTVKAQEAIQEAQNLARGAGNPEVTPEHLLLALLRQEGGIVAPILNKLGLNPGTIETEIAAEVAKYSKVGGASAEPMIGSTLRKVFDKAFEVATQFNDEYVSTEHFLLAIAQTKETTAAKILARHGAVPDALLKALQSVRGTQRVTDQNPKTNTSRSKSTAAISPISHAAARSIRSSAATTRSAASFRFSRGARRTIPFSSASRASARLPSWRGWPAASWRATSPKVSATSA